MSADYIKQLALMLALFSTAVSIGIAAFAGSERGGTIAEQGMTVALAVVSVLFVHLAPTWWSYLSVPKRLVMGALWLIGLIIVTYGQASFILLAQEHAGNVRAATMPVETIPAIAATETHDPVQIAAEVSKISLMLARLDAVGCHDSCPTLIARKAALTGRLHVLNVEATEAKRQEAAEDRNFAQVARDNALRDNLRADPVVSRLARWLGATDVTLSLSLATASAVVLEGTAIVGWLVVGVSPSRGARRASRADDLHTGTMSQNNATDIVPGEGVDHLPVTRETETIAVSSDDEREIERIHAAVCAGRLNPTQMAIRKFLGCGQQKAGHFNRRYAERFACVEGEVA